MIHKDIYDMMVDSGFLSKEERDLYQSSDDFAKSKVAEYCLASISPLQSEIQTTSAALDKRKERLASLMVALSETEGSEVNLDDFTYLATEGFRLAIQQSDRFEFTSLAVLLMLTSAPDEYVVTLFDYLKNPVQVSYLRFKEMMVDYGIYCYTLKQQGKL